MESKIIEATNGPNNWGKFLLLRPSADMWTYRSVIDDTGDDDLYRIRQPLLLQYCGWGPKHLLIVDLQTKEGFAVSIDRYMHRKLADHQIWVCPLFDPFLGWLAEQDVSDLNALPGAVDLPEAPVMQFGHRRSGPEGKLQRALVQLRSLQDPAVWVRVQGIQAAHMDMLLAAGSDRVLAWDADALYHRAVAELCTELASAIGEAENSAPEEK
jgi:hypothetical protein